MKARGARVVRFMLFQANRVLPEERKGGRPLARCQ
jgi:hypothetical protein